MSAGIAQNLSPLLGSSKLGRGVGWQASCEDLRFRTRKRLESQEMAYVDDRGRRAVGFWRRLVAFIIDAIPMERINAITPSSAASRLSSFFTISILSSFLLLFVNKLVWPSNPIYDYALDR